ncbi:MAG: tetratricopeptide repeat protein, partial [Psychromonas sp.]
SPMPRSAVNKKIIIILLSALLLLSSLGFSYLIFTKDNLDKGEHSLIPDVSSVVNEVVTEQADSGTEIKIDTPVLKVDSKNTVETELSAQQQGIDKELAPAGKPKVAVIESVPQEKVLQPVIVTKAISAKPIQAKPTVSKAIAAKPVTIKASSQKAVTKNVVKETKNDANLQITSSQLSDSELADIYLKEADKAELQGDNGLAAQKWQQALLLQPQLNQVRQSLALYYYAQGDIVKTTDLLKKGALESPYYSDFNLMLSRIATKEGDLQKAFLYLDQNPPVVAGHLDYHVSYAILAQKFEQFEKSEKLYSNLLLERPEDGRWRMSLAIAQDKQGKTAQAIESYQQALLETSLSRNAKAYINQRLSYLAENSGTL